MDKTSQLDCYLYFMWNVWCYDVCLNIFPSVIAKHLWDKWLRATESCGSAGAPAQFYSQVDADIRKTLVQCALVHYNR